MLTNPEMLWDLARQHQQYLIDEAERARVLRTARRYRRATHRRDAH